MKDIALYGDSAGGGLATSTVLNLRRPSAWACRQPWCCCHPGPTSAIPAIPCTPSRTRIRRSTTTHLLKTSAQAYADGLDLTDPRVSPMYGDFSKGFSPALITEGTKCIFLSTSVRLYQALEAAGQEVKLDVYEGLWHVFQNALIPETEVSLKKISAFLHEHLE